MRVSPESVQDIRQELSRVRAALVKSLPHQAHSDLVSFLNAYYKHDGLKVLVWAGFLGSGKTRSRHLANDLRQFYYQEDNRPIKIGTRTWEYAEKKGRLVGDIETAHGVPMKEEELLTASYILQEQVVDSMVNFKDTEVEAPVMTSFRVLEDGFPVYKGRELGLRAVYNLVWRLAEFAEIEPYTVWIAGLTAGEYLREVVPSFREAVHNSASIEEAQALAILCALDPPQDSEQWRMMKLDGASYEESVKVNAQFEKDVMPLYLDLRPGFANFGRQYIEADLMGHIFNSPTNLNLNEYRFFVGVNDSRKVSPDRQLLERFLESHGKMRLLDSQIRSLLDHVAKAADRLD